MLITISNDQISLTVDTHGAQMTSIRDRSDMEYLWQGDPAVWDERAPNLFPVIGRLWSRQHLVEGKAYPMKYIHGFASDAEFLPLVQEGNRLSLALCPSKEMESQYPFDFCMEISYVLHEREVLITARVGNIGEKTMPFALGGHPGFRVPLCEDEEFTDYYLEFSHKCHPIAISFSEKTVLMDGKDRPYYLQEDQRIPLTHSLFDADAIILRDADREVTLRSRKSGRGVRVTYPQMPYVGFWHMPHMEAEYVCIEPWTSLPGREGILEDLSCRSDYLRLEPQQVYENRWKIAVF